MKYILQILTLTMMVGCAPIEPSIKKINDTDYRITGKLYKLEYDEIIDIVQRHENQRINFYVSSHGGTSEDLFLAMDTVYRHGNVHWYALNDCSSACAVMALSTKHAHGTFRLHSFYSHHGHKVIPSPEYNELVLNKLRTYGYDTDRIHHMFHSVEELWPFVLNESEITE